jgi:hypothetical protein
MDTSSSHMPSGVSSSQQIKQQLEIERKNRNSSRVSKHEEVANPISPYSNKSARAAGEEKHRRILTTAEDGMDCKQQ